jgi:hypothetical protein
VAVRGFNDTPDAVVLAAGTNNITGAAPYTISCLLKRGTAGVWNPVIAGHLADNTQSWAIYFQGVSGGTGINRLTMINTAAGGTSNSTFTTTTTTAYVLIFFTCGGGFGDMGRWHKMDAGGAWTHEAGTEPGTPLRGLTDIAGGHLRLGESDGTPDFIGNMAFSCFWHANLTDAQVEAAAANLRIDDFIRHEITPASIWPLTQASTATPVADLLGTSNQTSLVGTFVVTGDDPAGWNLVASPLPLTFTFRLSGGAANSDPAASIGGARSTIAAPAGLFDDVAFAQGVAGAVDYRLVYVTNDSASNATAVAHVSTQLEAGRQIAVGAATEAAGATVTPIANDATPPAGVTFTAPTTTGTAISLGTINAGQSKGLWLRRTISPGTAPDPTNAWQITATITDLTGPAPATIRKLAGTFIIEALQPNIAVFDGTAWVYATQREWTGTDWFPPVL